MRCPTQPLVVRKFSTDRTISEYAEARAGGGGGGGLWWANCARGIGVQRIDPVTVPFKGAVLFVLHNLHSWQTQRLSASGSGYSNLWGLEESLDLDRLGPTAPIDPAERGSGVALGWAGVGWGRVGWGRGSLKHCTTQQGLPA